MLDTESHPPNDSIRRTATTSKTGSKLGLPPTRKQPKVNAAHIATLSTANTAATVISPPPRSTAVAGRTYVHTPVQPLTALTYKKRSDASRNPRNVDVKVTTGTV